MTHEPELLGANAQAQVKSIVERVETLEMEKAEIAEQIKEVYAEAKGSGFDTPMLRRAVRQRKIDKAKGRERKAILEMYCLALGDETLADLI